MKRYIQALLTCLATLLSAPQAPAAVINLNFVSAATGVDNGPQDGVFDAFTIPNLGSVDNNGFTSFRTAFEFSLSGLPPGSTINSATLTLVLSNFEGTRAIAVHGYGGDGTVQLSDFALNGLVGSANVGPLGTQTLSFDATGFIANLVQNGGTFAGFNVREDPANTSNFTVMFLDLHPLLSINFSAPPPPSGSHNLIVFTSPSPSNQVCTVDVVSKLVNCITTPPEESISEDRFPVWSPDGSRIAFERHSFAGSFIGCAIHTIKFDGSELTNVSGATYPCFSRPEWSPDGTKLSFYTSAVVSGNVIRGIDIATADGSSHTVLASTAGCTGEAPWAPLGDKLAISCPFSSPPGVYLVDANGDNLRPAYEIAGFIRDIKWSPQGDRLLFVRDTVGPQMTELWVVNSDGTNATLLQTSPVPGSGFNAAAWAPSGGKIAFDVPPFPEKAGDVFVINPDGTGLTNISQDPAYALEPTWSPDGSRIAFFSGRALPSSGIFVMNADGSDQTDLHVIGGSPDWSPAAADTTPPDTIIDSGPPATTIDTSATFEFHSTEGGSTFRCRLDGGSWVACSSLVTYTGLGTGSHAFQVTATDAAGNADATPASYAWAIASCPSTATSTITSSFNQTAIKAGSTIWFSSVVSAKGLDSSPITLHFDMSTITFTARSAPYTLAVPNAEITFSPTAAGATTVFDTGTNTWKTTVPSSGLAGNVFLSGIGFQVPVTLPGGINPVAWTGRFSSSTPGLSVNWKWAAAVYTSFSSDNNALGLKPVDDNKASSFKNADLAGTPEAFKKFITAGARGGGGSNFTGAYSGTGSATPCR